MNVRIVGYGDETLLIIILSIIFICFIFVVLYKRCIKHREKRNKRLWDKYGDK